LGKRRPCSWNAEEAGGGQVGARGEGEDGEEEGLPGALFAELNCSPAWRLASTHFRLRAFGYQQRWYSSSYEGFATVLAIEYYIANSCFAYDTRNDGEPMDASNYANGPKGGRAGAKMRDRMHVPPEYWFWMKDGRIGQAVAVETVVSEAFMFAID
jgi:hypothetical protein